MLKHTLISCVLIWLTPIVFGGVAGIFKIVLFQNFPFNPELEPDFVVYVAVSLYFIAGLVGSWLVSRYSRPRITKQPFRIASTTAIVFIFGYIFVRSATVESALASKYAYCCCCESVPTTSETFIRILSPIKI